MIFGETSWDRIARAGWIVCALFVIFAVHGVVSGADAREVTMTLVPAAACFALWRFAAARRDQILYGIPASPLQRIVGVVIIAAALVARLSVPVDRRADPRPTAIVAPALDQLEIVDVPAPNGSGTIKSLARKRDR